MDGVQTRDPWRYSPCVSRSGTMRARFITAATVFLSVLCFVRCSSDANAPSRIDITGQWALNLSYSNSQHGVSCSAQSVLVAFAQTDSAFTGTVVSGSEICSAGHSDYDQSDRPNLDGRSDPWSFAHEPHRKLHGLGKRFR